MGMNSRMSARSQNKREAAVAKMYKDDKNFRADKLKKKLRNWLVNKEVNCWKLLTCGDEDNQQPSQK